MAFKSRVLQQSHLYDMQLLSSLILGAVASLAVAAPAPVPHVLHEKRERAPRAWAKRGKVDPTVVLPVRIGLTQRNLDKGAFLLDEVYVISFFAFMVVSLASYSLCGCIFSAMTFCQAAMVMD